MAVLTVRMPDDRHSRLKALAASQGVSVNKMIEELTTAALVEFDTHIDSRREPIEDRRLEGLKYSMNSTELTSK
jgi:plasmid stability protein